MVTGVETGLEDGFVKSQGGFKDAVSIARTKSTMEDYLRCVGLMNV
jgi:hypothetical protein